MQRVMAGDMRGLSLGMMGLRDDVQLHYIQLNPKEISVVKRGAMEDTYILAAGSAITNTLLISQSAVNVLKNPTIREEILYSRAQQPDKNKAVDSSSHTFQPHNVRQSTPLNTMSTQATVAGNNNNATTTTTASAAATESAGMMTDEQQFGKFSNVMDAAANVSAEEFMQMKANNEELKREFALLKEERDRERNKVLGKRLDQIMKRIIDPKSGILPYLQEHMPDLDLSELKEATTSESAPQELLAAEPWVGVMYSALNKSRGIIDEQKAQLQQREQELHAYKTMDTSEGRKRPRITEGVSATTHLSSSNGAGAATTTTMKRSAPSGAGPTSTTATATATDTASGGGGKRDHFAFSDTARAMSQLHSMLGYQNNVNPEMIQNSFDRLAKKTPLDEQRFGNISTWNQLQSNVRTLESFYADMDAGKAGTKVEEDM